MKIKQLFESLTDQEKLELADEIRAILKYEHPVKQLTPLNKCLDLKTKSGTIIGDLLPIRIRNVFELITNPQIHWFTGKQMNYFYETITHKELRMFRNFGKKSADWFVEIRDNNEIIYD